MERGEGFVESMLPEEQESGQKLILPENAYTFSGSVKAIYAENHAEEEMEIFTGQRLGKVHSLYIDEEAWLKEELRGSSKLVVEEGEDGMLSVNVNSVQKSDYPTK